jgi:hypothetical protein
MAWMLRAWPVVLALGGCNWVFGLAPTERTVPDDAFVIDGDPRVDLDRDDIKDVVDPCIAPAADALVDSDLDGVPNGEDPCPFDGKSQNDLDGDGDGIPDSCDPTRAAGDRVRCVMAFRDPDLNHAMWKQRGPNKDWVVESPTQLYGLSGASGIVADWPFEGPAVTSYDVRGVVGQVTQSEASVTVSPRASAVPDDADVACSLYSAGTGTLFELRFKGGMTQTFMPQLLGGAQFRMVATIGPGHNAEFSLARCDATVTLQGTSVSLTIGTEVPLVPGHLAFDLNNVDVSITGLTVYERDAAPQP